MALNWTRSHPASAVPSVYQLLPSSSIPLPSYALPLSHRDSQTTANLANLINHSTPAWILHAHLHSLNLPPSNASGTHPVPRRPRKRARLAEAEAGQELGSESEGETTRANADGEDSGLARDRTRPRRKQREGDRWQPKRMPQVKVERVGLGQGQLGLRSLLKTRQSRVSLPRGADSNHNNLQPRLNGQFRFATRSKLIRLA